MTGCCTNHRDGECWHAAAVAEFGRTPSAGVCARCPHYSGPPRGLGDVVHSVAVAIGIPKVTARISKDCGCEERRRRLNEIAPNPLKGP